MDGGRTSPRSSCGMTGGVRRGEAAGFSTCRKASDSVTRAGAPVMEGLPAAAMASISPLQPVPPHASKTPDNSDASPSIPDNKHHKHKKTKTFGLDISATGQAG